jgi:hypothetical protein
LRPNHKMIWEYDNNRLVVPKRTKVSFIEIPAIPEKGQMLLCRISFERPGYYSLHFDISPGAGQFGKMPAGFVPQQVPGVVTWTVTVRMHYQIEKRTDDGFSPELYSAWADALFDGLRKNMGFN